MRQSAVSAARAFCLLFCSFLSVFTVLRSESAWANDDVAKVEKLYAEGASLFGSGRYQQALSKFVEAYHAYPAANLLFNIARCHEALGKVDLALASYRRFVMQPGIDGDTKALAERKMADLQDAKAQGTGYTPRRPGSGTTTPIPRMTQQPKDDQSFSPWQYIALGAGAAVVAGGVVTMILGLRDQDDAHSMRDCAEERTCNPPPRLDEINSKQDSADTKKVLGYALIGIGGALVITGSVLLILDLSKDDEPVVARKPNRYALAFDVMPMLGGGAASVSGRF